MYEPLFYIGPPDYCLLCGPEAGLARYNIVVKELLQFLFVRISPERIQGPLPVFHEVFVLASVKVYLPDSISVMLIYTAQEPL